MWRFLLRNPAMDRHRGGCPINGDLTLETVSVGGSPAEPVHASVKSEYRFGYDIDTDAAIAAMYTEVHLCGGGIAV
jgi:hypothetical protein